MKLTELTKNQQYVVRAIYELRISKETTKLEDSWIKKRTSALKKQNGEIKTGGVSRQQWTAPFGSSKTEKDWEQIGKAVRGRLPYNNQIEVIIRSCKSSDSVLVAQLKEIIVQLETRVKNAEEAKVKATAAFDDFKSNYYNEQCTDAHFRINFNKTMVTNKNLIAAAKIDQDTIKGLLSQVSTLSLQVQLLESKLADEDLKLGAGVESIKKPRIFEPQLTGMDESLEDEDLLVMYEKTIDVRLGDLENLAKKIHPDVSIVFHEFNADIKTLVAEGKVPFRSARMDNLVFACHAGDKNTRMAIYRRISAISESTPRVVVVSGKGKVEHLPVKERNGVDNHDWFVTLVRTDSFRKTPINALNEGYDTVMYRRLGDGK